MKYVRNITFALTLMTINISVYGQNFHKELCGFKLGDSRNSIREKLGEPRKKDKFEDGFEWEGFLINQDKTLQITFEYSVDNLNTVWSIQVSGTNDLKDLDIRGIKLGASNEVIEKLFGKPTTKINIGEFGRRWEYKNSNFSFEVKNNKLTSVKIVDK